MSLMEQFSNPETMQSLSFGDKMAGTGITALMGMGITFSILFLLWFIIATLSRIIAVTEAKTVPERAGGAATPVVEPAPAPAMEPARASVGSESEAGAEGVDPEIIAVIMAAIAAEEGPALTVSDLVVRRIRRVDATAPAWARAGRSEVIDSRRM